MLPDSARLSVLRILVFTVAQLVRGGFIILRSGVRAPLQEALHCAGPFFFVQNWDYPPKIVYRDSYRRLAARKSSAFIVLSVEDLIFRQPNLDMNRSLFLAVACLCAGVCHCRSWRRRWGHAIRMSPSPRAALSQSSVQMPTQSISPTTTTVVTIFRVVHQSKCHHTVS